MKPKTIKKKSKENTYSEILDVVILFVAFFFIITTVFDLSVTVTFYVINPDHFMNNEANFLFVWGVKNHFPLILNPSVFINILLLFGLIDSRQRFKKQNTKLRMIYLISTILVAIVLSIAHGIGGMSWLYDAARS